MNDSNDSIEVAPFITAVCVRGMWPPDCYALYRPLLAYVAAADVPGLAAQIGLADSDLWRNEHGEASIILGEANVNHKPKDSYTVAGILRWTGFFRRPQQQQEQAAAVAMAEAAERERQVMAGLQAERERLAAEEKRKRESTPEFLTARLQQLEAMLSGKS